MGCATMYPESKILMIRKYPLYPSEVLNMEVADISGVDTSY
jgi:hypothetical protein